MASEAISGVGTIFRRWSGSAWVNVGEVRNISGPSMSRDTIDVSNMSTSTDGYREFIAGLRDGGEVTFTMNFVRDDYDTMKDDFESDTLVAYEIVLDDAEKTSIEFSGLVTGLPMNITFDEAVTCDITIKISGQSVVESGSGS